MPEQRNKNDNMKFNKIDLQGGRALAEMSIFEPEGKLPEYHLIIHVNEQTLRFDAQKEIYVSA